MSIHGNKTSLLKSIEFYEGLLNKMTDEEFLLSPAEGVWSCAEVYSHIMQANLYSLTAIEKCTAGTGKITLKRIHWIAGLILFFGRFPPGKFKVPKSMAGMVAKMSREDARNLTLKFKHRLLETVPKIKKAAPAQKVSHPRLGMLNAPQWLRFIEVHTRHHIRQLDRIRKMNKLLI